MHPLSRRAPWLLSLSLAFACGGPARPPTRGVIESDIDGWGFRRDQGLLDVEVWVTDNKAQAHTASYARKAAEKTGRLHDRDVIHAFVTRYEKPDGIYRALVVFARRLAQQSGYQVEERVRDGVRFFQVQGAGEHWILWSARSHVVKLGGRGIERVPGDLIEAYAEYYPSHIQEGALEGPLPDGPAEPEVEAEEVAPNDKPRPTW